MLTNKSNVKNKHRPIGIWILTIYALIFAGIYPLLLDPLELFVLGRTAFYSSDDVPFILIQTFINIGIIFTSVLTWRRWEIARKLFLILTTIYFGWVIQVMFLWITHSSFVNNPISEKIMFWILGIGNIFFVVLNVWYFNKPSIKEFFRK